MKVLLEVPDPSQATGASVTMTTALTPGAVEQVPGLKAALTELARVFVRHQAGKRFRNPARHIVGVEFRALDFHYITAAPVPSRPSTETRT